MDDLETRIRDFIHQEIPGLREIRADVDLVNDSYISGDDVWELVDRFAHQFNVRMEGFRWYHHSGPEGCNPLWLLFAPWWARKTHVPIRIADLVASARSGEWCLPYPPSEAEPEETPDDRYHTRVGCAILAGGVVLMGVAIAVACVAV